MRRLAITLIAAALFAGRGADEPEDAPPSQAEVDRALAGAPPKPAADIKRYAE